MFQDLDTLQFLEISIEKDNIVLCLELSSISTTRTNPQVSCVASKNFELETLTLSPWSHGLLPTSENQRPEIRQEERNVAEDTSTYPNTFQSRYELSFRYKNPEHTMSWWEKTRTRDLATEILSFTISPRMWAAVVVTSYTTGGRKQNLEQASMSDDVGTIKKGGHLR